MEIATSTLGVVTIVTIVGEIDGRTAPAAQEQIMPLCKPNVNMLLDMSQVEYMSSAGLRLMLLLHRQITGANGQLVLVGLSDDIKDTMSATGFLDYLTTYDTLDAGMATFQ